MPRLNTEDMELADAIGDVIAAGLEIAVAVVIGLLVMVAIDLIFFGWR